MKALETASVPRYCALAADYEPANGGLMSLVRDGLADLVFGKAGNDLVVPTAGVWDEHGGSGFPIAERKVYPADAAIQHSGYFRDAAARRELLDWLTYVSPHHHEGGPQRGIGVVACTRIGELQHAAGTP